MKLKLFYILVILCTVSTFSQKPMVSCTDRGVTAIISNHTFDFQNTIIYGPDDNLWIRELKGQQIVNVGTTITSTYRLPIAYVDIGARKIKELKNQHEQNSVDTTNLTKGFYL